MKKIPMEVYDRCVGYFRPISHMNKGKQEEQAERLRASKEFIVDSVKEESCLHT